MADLRDALTENFDKLDGTEKPETTTPAGPPVTQEGEPKTRDEKGRFVKPETTAETKPTTVERPPRPSSWKKEYWDHWEKLDPALATYLHQREQEYASGVSTYKNEWENAKPILEAMEPFLPALQQHGVSPNEWLKNVGTVHSKLVSGSPQEKLGIFLQIARDHQIPLEQLFVRGQDGQVYLNPQIGQAPPTSAPAQQPDIRELVQSTIAEQETQRDIERFAADPKYPHFEQIKDAMAGLLQAGLADDLQDAYETALKLPKHAELYSSVQEAQRQQDEAARLEEQKKQVQKAKSNTISPKGSTPSPAANGDGRKGIREQLSEAFDSIASGRV